MALGELNRRRRGAMNTISKWLTALALLSAPMVVVADTIAYDDITSNVVSSGGDWFGYNAPPGGSYVVGDQFTPTAALASKWRGDPHSCLQKSPDDQISHSSLAINVRGSS
jgi:hypothetical protein